MESELGLLRDQRIQKSIEGLEHRLDSKFEILKSIQSDTTKDKDVLRKDFEGNALGIRDAHARQLATSVTDSDSQLNDTWTAFDRDTLRSLQGEKNAVNEIRRTFVKTRDTTTADRERTVTSLKTQAQVDRDKLHQVFESNKEQLKRFRQENDTAYNQAVEFATNRFIKFAVPNRATDSKLDNNAEASFASNKQLIATRVAELQTQLNQLTKRPIARFSESWQVWAAALVFSGLIAAIFWLSSANLATSTRMLISMIVVVVGSVLSGLFAFLVIRLIIKKHVRVAMPAMSLQHRDTISLIEDATVQLKNGLQSRIQLLEEKLKQDIAQAISSADRKLTEAKSIYDRSKVEVAETQAAKRGGLLSNFDAQYRSILNQSTSNTQSIRNEFQSTLSQIQEQLNHQLASKDQQEREQTAYARHRITSGLTELKTRFSDLGHSLNSLCPPWPSDVHSASKSARASNDLAYLTVGHFDLEIGHEHESALNQLHVSPLKMRLPLVYKMIEHGLLKITCNSRNHAQAQSLVRNLILKAFYTLPPGSLQVTIIDPDGLGREYAHLMQLADSDPTMVNHRVWTQNVHISEQLAKLSHHTEDVIQQLLRDRYRDIRQYNREAGTMAEPYRLVVWSRFPAGVDDASWRYLSSLVNSGGRCGVCTILLVDEDISLPPNVDLNRLDNIGLHLNLNSSGSNLTGTLSDETLKRYPIAFDAPPEPQVQNEILKRVAQEALQANRVEVPFDSMVPPTSTPYQSRSASGLSIPVGQAGVGRIQHLRLGHGTAQHVLVAGKTGSGKSSFLHTLVTSAAHNYSPEELRLVLLDFKKGVEFQVYSEAELSHADIIGIESQREFGLSVFEYLDRIMQRRGEAFRSAGVQDIPGWCKAHPDKPMPRILIVVDEFQEIFTEDDKLAQQAAMYLDRIVRQGRSFGLHVVLASQTLGGAYSLPRTTLAQMAVRVALQCEGADAMMILSEDNLAAERLRHSGQAVYNDQSGRIEGNQPFQVAYLHKERQREILGGLEKHPRLPEATHGGLEKCVVFDGHRKATWNQTEIDALMAQAKSENAKSPVLLLGDSVSIEPALHFPLHRQAGQNVLVVGQDDENQAAVLRSLMTSYLLNQSDAGLLTYVDASRDEDKYSKSLLEIMERSGTAFNKVPGSKVDDTVVSLHAVLKDRMQALDEQTEVSTPLDFTPHLIVISHLGRLRSLRRNDEFSFDDSDQPKIDKLFQDILRDGPSVGIHSCVACDGANTVNRWLSRQSLHDFDYRILMQMSVNDSNHLIDSAAANRLDKNVLLLYVESTGVIRKFRPYSLD